MQRSTRESSRRQFLRRAGATAAAGSFVFRAAAETHSADETWLSRGGKAGGVIVIGKEAGQFYRWVAEELARYLQLLTGADFRIGTSTEAVSEGVRVLVGGP